MASVAKAVSTLTGAFLFLVTLLFDSSMISSPFSGEGSPVMLAIIAGTIFAMAAFALLFLFLERAVPRLSWTIAMGASAILPFVSLVLLLPFALSGVDDRVPPMASVVIMGIAAISQIHCFVQGTTLNSRGLFLASGISIGIALLLTHIASSSLDAPSYGTVFVAAILSITGIVTCLVHRGASPAEQHSKVEDRHGSNRQNALEIAALTLPLIFASLFCTLTLGQTWENRLLSEFDSQGGLLLLAFALELVFVAVVYLQWERTMSVDVLLASLVVPLSLPILASLFENLIPSSWIVTMLLLSQVLCLLFSWTSALLIGRTVSKGDSITPVFVVMFLVLYAIFMLMPKIQDAVFASRVISLLSLCLMAGLLLYFFKKATAPSAHEGVSMEISGMLRKKCDDAAKRYGLSPRESELLPMLVVGLSAGAIGRRVVISEHTVKTHRYRIYQKFGVANHEELVDKLDLINEDAES